MTPETQRIAIAEACGYKRNVWTKGDGKILASATFSWVRPNRVVCQESGLPDYLNDLNAMHRAENLLEQRGLWWDYAKLLNETTLGKGEKATASQRAETFLHVIGKWTNEDS